MAKKDNETDGGAPKPSSLELDRTYSHLGRPYGPGVVIVGTGGVEAGEIEQEGFDDLTKAVDRAKQADADRERSKLAINAREDARRERIRLESAE